MLLIVILFLAAIGEIVASPFGILFAGESTGADAVPVSCAVAQVNYVFNERLEELQTADTYDDVTIQGETADWVRCWRCLPRKSPEAAAQMPPMW